MNRLAQDIRYRITLMRPKHWLKNILIFVPIVFSKRMLEPKTFAQTIGGFFAFSFLSSAIYILNDIRDVEADRQHEIKKNRPIASGKVSITSAYVQLFLLVAAAVMMNIWVCGLNGKCFAFMLAYFVINVCYSMGLKHIPFVDISLLVTGFIFRVLYGAAIINESVSPWLSMTTLALSFYLSLGKRRNELMKSNGQTETRKVLKYYSYNFLDKFMYLCLSIAIVFYALWSADDAIIERYHTDKLIWTVPLVILLMMKYSADIESDSHGDPVDVVTHDKYLLLLALAYGLILILLIYAPVL